MHNEVRGCAKIPLSSFIFALQLFRVFSYLNKIKRICSEVKKRQRLCGEMDVSHAEMYKYLQYIGI